MRGVAGAVLLAGVLAAGVHPVKAATTDEEAERATERTYLAYVATGDDTIDATSRIGLSGLADALARRTSVDPGVAGPIDPETDELAFYPLLYWPITADQPALSERARAKINAYMHNGGVVLFDTRDQNASQLSGDGSAALQTLAEGLDIPALVPVPADHVLTRSFYLLNDFPGRTTGGEVWVAADATAANDGVSPVIVGGHDWAAAWAIDRTGSPLYAAVPGGERQREMAYRFGINVVMYVLTGNYKADQVHVPAILERLGR